MCVSTSLPLLLVLSNHPKRKNHAQKQHGFTMHDKRKKKLLLEMIQYCVSELTITDRSGVVEHSHPPITEYVPGKQKKKKKLYIKRTEKLYLRPIIIITI